MAQDKELVIANSAKNEMIGSSIKQEMLSSRQLAEVQRTISHFDDFRKFLEAVNPDKQVAICRNPEGCFTRDFPTLITLDRAYKSKLYPSPAASWLIPQLTDLCTFCGVKDKLSSNQLRNIAEIIAMEYPYVKTSEMMLFFHRFKLRYYGEFFGYVDPLKITSALAKFMDYRCDMLNQVEQKQRAEREDEDKKDCISYREWCEMTGRDPDKPITLKLGQ